MIVIISRQIITDFVDEWNVEFTIDGLVGSRVIPYSEGQTDQDALTYLNARYVDSLKGARDTHERDLLNSLKEIDHSGINISAITVQDIFSKIDTWFPDGQVISPLRIRQALKFIIKLLIQVAKGKK
ncbi:MAG: hypothetical protein KAJ07_00530 [Planctomycetes bacterium]|nr:hypothetical protein [Planctomycetota bacterium]